MVCRQHSGQCDQERCEEQRGPGALQEGVGGHYKREMGTLQEGDGGHYKMPSKLETFAHFFSTNLKPVKKKAWFFRNIVCDMIFRKLSVE